MKLCIYIFLSIFILCGTTFALPPNGISLFAHLDQKHGQSGTDAYSGCWGWTAPNGKEYAIVGTYTGTAIIDITTGATEVAYISGPS